MEQQFCSGCYKKNAIDWVAYEQQKFISHSSGGWTSEIKALAESVSGDGPPAGIQLSSQMEKMPSTPQGRSQGALSSFCCEDTNPIPESSTLMT